MIKHISSGRGDLLQSKHSLIHHHLSLLGLPKYSLSNRFAIYIPLFLPISIPVVLSLIAAIKWGRDHNLALPPPPKKGTKLARWPQWCIRLHTGIFLTDLLSTFHYSYRSAFPLYCHWSRPSNGLEGRTRNQRMTEAISTMPLTAHLLQKFIIDREAREIIELVASVRPFACTLMAEPFDLWPWYLACRLTFTLARLGL